MKSPYWSYFSRPFPKAEGFSAYRMPGLVVHLPVLLIFLSLGFWLCSWGLVLMPLLLVYAVIGLYLGRDLAILAHYNPLITIAVLVAAFFLIGVHPEWPTIPPVAAMVLTVLLAALFRKYVDWWIAEMTEDMPELHKVVLYGSPEELEQVLAAGADPNQEGDTWSHQRPLHAAIEGIEDPVRINRIIDILVGQGADLNALSHQGTPLQLAVQRHQPGVVRHLLQLGASPNVADRYGKTALHEAVDQGDQALIEELIAAGADLNSAGGKSLLREAVWAGQTHLLPWLIEHGARALPDDEALTMVAGMLDPKAEELAQQLLEAGAVMQDEVLYGAAMPEMMRFAATHGASVERLCASGKNPAFVRGHDANRAERLATLRDLGCDLLARDKRGHNVLHDLAGNYWAMMTLPDALPVLQSAGLDINAPDSQGNTALHLQVAELSPLLTGEACIPGESGKLPVQDAIRLLEPLLKAGADPQIANGQGESVVALAKRLKAPKAFIKALARR